MKRILFTLIALMLAAPAMASDRFSQIDRNGDGAVDWSEFETAMPQMKRKAFDIIDTNKDGRISREEWNAFGMSHGKQTTESNASQAPASSGHADRPLIQPPTK